MKNILRNFRLLLLTSLLLILTNCQVEENIIPNQLQNTQQKYSIKNLSQNEIAFNSKIVENLKYLSKNKSNPLEKKQPINELGLIINTDFAKFIEKGKYNSYTFSTVQKYNENIKNILFSLNENGEYDTFLVEYKYNKQELLNSSPNKLSQETKISPIEINLKKSITAKTKIMAPIWICTYEYDYVEKGDLVGAGNERYEWVLKFSDCVVINAEIIESTSTSTGNGTSTYTTSGSMAYSGGSGGATTPTPSIYDGDELVKISVVKNKLNVSGQQSRFLDQNGQIAFEVYDYISKSMFSNESITFSKEIINQMILNPTIFNSITPFLIEKQIDGSQLEHCLKGIMEQLKKATNSDIANVMAKLDATNEYTVTMKMGSMTKPINIAETTKISKNNYLITVSQNTYTSATKLHRATTLLHEIIHAYMLSIVDDYNTYPTNAPFTNFPELFKTYVSKINNVQFADIAQHEDMANKYVNAIASALEQYQLNDTGIPSTLADKQVFLDMAWSGLRGTDVYDKKFPAGGIDDNRIFARIAAEQTQGYNAIGKPCN